MYTPIIYNEEFLKGLSAEILRFRAKITAKHVGYLGLSDIKTLTLSKNNAERKKISGEKI